MHDRAQRWITFELPLASTDGLDGGDGADHGDGFSSGVMALATWLALCGCAGNGSAGFDADAYRDR